MIPLYYPGKDFVARQSALARPENTPLYGMVVETWWQKPVNP
jgi:ABC-type oligopeptide transport system substrate-binding subunit